MHGKNCPASSRLQFFPSFVIRKGVTRLTLHLTSAVVLQSSLSSNTSGGTDAT